MEKSAPATHPFGGPAVVRGPSAEEGVGIIVELYAPPRSDTVRAALETDGEDPAVNDHGIAIRVADVSKRFVIRTEKSLKERLINFGRSNLHKQDFYALSHVSVDIRSGSTVGLIGPNGSGKSTLLKTIGGILQPSSGFVQHRGRIAALLELGAGFHPDLTGRENVFLNSAILGISKAETERNLPEILEFSGIGPFIDTQVKFYSSGMYVRLAFAVAVHVNPDILIVDEVLAVGDEPFQRKCMDRIRQLQTQGKTIVLVTHSLDQVSEFCDRVIVLEAGTIVFDGEPGPAIHRLRDDFESVRVKAAADADPKAVRLGARTIDRVELRSASTGQPIDAIRAGEGLVIDILVTAARPTDTWCLGIEIESARGQIMVATDTRLLDMDTPAIQGERVVRFEIASLALGTGRYFVSSFFGDADVEEARISQAASFYVANDDRTTGVVSPSVVGVLLGG